MYRIVQSSKQGLGKGDDENTRRYTPRYHPVL